MKKRKKRKPQVASNIEIKPKLFPSSFWIKVAIIIQFILLAWQFYPSPSTNGDNAKYYILGTALSELKGYRQIHLPNEPVETQYPVLFPMFLGIIQFFSDTLFLSKIIIAGIGVMVTLLFFYFGKNYLGYLLIPLIFLVASSALISEYSIILMSEVPYLLFTILALYMYQRSLNKPKSQLLFYTAIVMSVLPIHCRSIGLAFSAAFIIVNLFMKRYRYIIAHIALLICTIVLFKSATSWDNPYILQLFQKNSYDPEMGYVTFAEMVIRIAGNIKKYSTLIFGKALLPSSDSFPKFLTKLISIICSIFILAGWIRILFTPLRMISVYTLFYFGILSMWQIQWSSERFLVSITPFLFLFIFYGFDTLIRSITSEESNILIKFFNGLKQSNLAQLTRRKNIVVWIITAIFIFVNVHHRLAYAEKNKKLGPDWRNYYSCADWIRLNTPEDAIIMSRKAEMLYLRSKRKGFMYPFTHNVERMIEIMKKEDVSYIVLDNFFWTKTTVRYLIPVIKSHPEMFKVVYALKKPDTYILEFVNK